MRPLLLPLLFTALINQGLADTVVLKSGDKVNGKILQESETEVTIAVQISAAVTDERVIKKDEIASVEKDQPDEIAFREIKNLKPDPLSSYSVETYDRLLTSLGYFQRTYPASAHHAEVQQNLNALDQEKIKVVTGEVKYLGRWLTKENAAKRRIQIDAQNFLGAMKQQAAAGDLIGALNTFDLFEKSYSTTRFYPDAITLARELLPRLKQALLSRAQTQAYERQQFQQAVTLAAEPQKSELIAADKREQTGYVAALAASQKNNAKWPPFIPRSPQSIDALQAVVPGEVQRLAQLPVPKMRDSISMVDQARTALEAQELDLAERLLRGATQLWSQNEAAIYWTQQVKDARAAALATPSPSAAPVSSPSPAQATKTSSTTTPHGAPSSVVTPALSLLGGLAVMAGAGVALGRSQDRHPPQP